MNLADFCAEVKNWFYCDKPHSGIYTIYGGTFALPFLQEEQYFRITGSVFNDGVYQYPVEGLHDEAFSGDITPMNVPQDVFTLIDRISAWETENAKVINSPYQSESFAGYSYSLKSGASADGSGGGLTWQGQFSKELNRWRKA